MHVIAFPTCTAVYLNSDYIFQQCWGLQFEIQQLYHSYESTLCCFAILSEASSLMEGLV